MTGKKWSFTTSLFLHICTFQPASFYLRSSFCHFTQTRWNPSLLVFEVFLHIRVHNFTVLVTAQCSTFVHFSLAISVKSPGLFLSFFRGDCCSSARYWKTCRFDFFPLLFLYHHQIKLSRINELKTYSVEVHLKKIRSNVKLNSTCIWWIELSSMSNWWIKHCFAIKI